MYSITKQVIPIKRVKKDGSLDREIVERIAAQVREGKMVAMPVDSVFGILGKFGEINERRIASLYSEKSDNVVYMISSFKMLDELAEIDKTEYDFLHRVWPGEVVVKLKRKDPVKGNAIISVRYPKNKFVQDIISRVDAPCIFTACLRFRNKRVFKTTDIFEKYKKANIILLIEEFCKKHPSPTIIDVARGELVIENEGRIPAEEIKSLYFL
jgi:tRNA A37 threonylcarbamoyladenosine synthetase subunit TsaC/SUA5/YrdC